MFRSAFGIAAALQGQAVAAPVAVPMAASAWHAAAPVPWVSAEAPSMRFDDRAEGFPNGIATLNHMVMVSDHEHFTNGTIDFDIKPLAYDYTGVIFRRDDAGDGEFFYLRGDPDCPASDDCYQYTPIVHGMLDWNVFPNYQGPAPIAPSGWNHVHLVVAGQKMAVYLNYATRPVLIVPKLLGTTAGGGIALKGPAIYANLVVDPDMPSLPEIPPPAPDPTALTAWEVAAPTRWPTDRAVPASGIPPATAWRTAGATSWGLVDLARIFGPTAGTTPEIAWLRTTIDTAEAGRRVLHLGWVNQASVFLDGKRVFAGENLYYPVARRLSADGRLEPDNASIPLDLAAGRNELVLAIGDADVSGATPVATHDGWAAEAHLEPSGR